jgi:ABC-type phosphate transport system auxiliary subunit
MRLVNDYYANYDEFNEGYFVKLLNPNDEGKLYLDIGAYKRKNYTENMMEESEIEKCVTKLKIISIQGRIKQTQKQISTTLDSKTKLKLVASVETLKRQEANLKAKLVKHN